MKSIYYITTVVFAVLILIFLSMITPRPSDALKPLDDQKLQDLSPSLKEEIKIAASTVAADSRQTIRQPAVLATCFFKCHKKTDFRASDKTKRQWLLLIGKNGHDIFAPIPWKSGAEKKRVLEFLLKHASNARSGSEGIGVW